MEIVKGKGGEMDLDSINDLDCQSCPRFFSLLFIKFFPNDVLKAWILFKFSYIICNVIFLNRDATSESH